MKRIILLLLLIGNLQIPSVYADTLQLRLIDAEALLLQNNLSLLAEQLSLKVADAELIQAKIWPNPVLSVGDFNLYTSPAQKAVSDELPIIFGNEYGKYQQLTVQLEQLVYLSGKRRKLQDIASVSKEKAAAYLSDFLWNLKIGFRQKVYEYQYCQQLEGLLYKELESFSEIVNAYQKQVEKGNVSKVKLMRLKATEMSLREEMIHIQIERHQLLSELIVFLRLPENTFLIFEDTNNPTADKLISLIHLQDSALLKRPELHFSYLENKQAEKEWIYEKSLAVPDLTLSANYERGSGLYPNFWGLGASIDLPFSNSNKGNIKAAGIRVEQQKMKTDELILKTKTDVRNKYFQLIHYSDFFKSMPTKYISDLEQTMEAYTRYFREQSISILEFIDFMETYIENKTSIFELQKNYKNALEELRYATGVEKIFE